MVMYHTPLKHCKSCEEYIFAIEVLRHDTSSHYTVGEIPNFSYCPFCGKEIKDEQEEEKGMASSSH